VHGDRISRESSATGIDCALLESFGNLKCPDIPKDGLEVPCDDCNFAFGILKVVENNVKKWIIA
jgi:hypothetical protein